MAKKSQARTWFLVHSWLALPVWFFLLIICVTGTLATVSQEIIWLANPDVRANKPADDAQRLTHEQVIQAIEQKAPEVIVRSIGRPDEGHFALNVQTTYPDGSSPTLYVNRRHPGRKPAIRFPPIYPCTAWLVAGALHQWL